MEEKTIIEQLAEARAEIDALTQKNTLLEQQNATQDAARQDAEAHAADFAALAESNAADGSALADELKAAKDANAELAQQNAALAARVEQLEAEARSAESRAAEIAGHAREPISVPAAAGMSPEALQAKWNAVKDSPRARSEFWQTLSAAERNLIKI